MENPAIWPRSSVALTLIAEEMQAGSLIAFTYPSFPAAMTVAIPTERRLSMAALVAALSASHTAWELYAPAQAHVHRRDAVKEAQRVEDVLERRDLVGNV